MLTGLWTVGIKVPDLERELEFHQAMGNDVVLDDTIEFEGEHYRIPLIRVGDKYAHIAERMVYERLLPAPLPHGIVHLVYRSGAIEQDVERALAAGAELFIPLTTVKAGFGTRRVAFFKSPSGYIFEIIEIIENLVPAV
jgi:catechol 2,3-dioxygenase-like lactoylglutathione lyase family enzyme